MCASNIVSVDILFLVSNFLHKKIIIGTVTAGMIDSTVRRYIWIAQSGMRTSVTYFIISSLTIIVTS